MLFNVNLFIPLHTHKNIITGKKLVVNTNENEQFSYDLHLIVLFLNLFITKDDTWLKYCGPNAQLFW